MLVVRAADRAEAEALAIALVPALATRGMSVRVAPAPVEVPGDGGAIDEAERAYHALHPDHAIALLDGTLGELDRGERALERDELVRALLILAMAHGAVEHEDAADAAIDRALAVEPALAPDPARHPPTLLERIAARRAARAGLEDAALHVGVEPRHAAIAIDGAPAGPDARVAPGRHVVEARAPGHRRVARAVDVTADASLELALPRDPSAVLARPGAPLSAIDPALHGAARDLGATLLVVDLVPRDDRVSLVARDGERSASIELARARGTRAAAESLAAALTAEPVEPADPVRWIVGGAGAAAAIAVAIAVGVVVAGQAPSSFGAVGTVER